MIFLQDCFCQMSILNCEIICLLHIFLRHFVFFHNGTELGDLLKNCVAGDLLPVCHEISTENYFKTTSHKKAIHVV